tara:strand:- start:189 stop:395 length:207 start_codon:yes stop_codon:yes gene_type:complete
MIRVEGHSNLYRDERTGAIVNCDDVGYMQHVKYLENRKKQKREMNDLRKELDEIKSLLKNLVEGDNKS